MRLFAAFLAAFAAIQAQAQLFTDDFSRGSDPGPLSPWVVAPAPNNGNWSVTGGALVGGTNAANTFGFAYVTNSWTNYSVQARVRFSTVNADAGGLGGRLNPFSGGHYAAFISPEGSANPSTLLLAKFQYWDGFEYTNVTFQPMLPRVSLPSVGTNWHTLKLAFQGNQISVYYDSNLVASVTDTESNPYMSGGIVAGMSTVTTPFNLFVDDLTVTALPSVLMAVNDTYTVAQNGALTVAAPGVLGNDTAAPAKTLTAVRVANPSKGTLTMNANGGFTYTPSNNFAGVDSFTYWATDGTSTSSVATVAVVALPSTNIFFDNFARTGPGSSFAPWVTGLGEWNITGGQLLGTGTIMDYYSDAYIPTKAGDFAVQTRFQLPSGGWACGVSGRINPVTGERYVCNVYPETSPYTPTPSIRLIKFHSWGTWSATFTPMAQVILSSVGTSFHTLKMALYGNTIDVYFDGTRVIHVTDDNVDGIPFYRSGAFGAHMYMYTHYTATFDDYSVSALPGINYPPVLPAQANQNIAPGIALVVTNTATDVDVPANTLTYALQNAPAGAAIGTNGIITWTPTAGQNLTTNLLTTIVTDFNPTATNSQHLSATNSFTVIVNNRAALVPTSTALLLEGCGPTNNAVDPGETVTMGFGFQNVGFANTTNLVATLLSVNGITPISGPQTYGLVAAGGPPTSQAFTFSAGGGCGSTVNATFQMQDGANNLGNVSVPLQLGGFFAESFESASTPGLPAGWTTSASGAELNWITSAFSSSSPPNSAFVPDVANIGTADLISPPIPLPLGASQLSFANSYELETNSANPSEAFDGGVLEIKMGANAFTDILAAGGSFVTNGYTLPISTSWGNPLGGRQAWSGSSGGFLTTIVNLPASAAGQTIQLRWRVGTDSSNGKPGWRIDSVAVLVRSCCVSSGPVLTGQPNRTITELTTLVVTNTATEAGAPPGSLTYALLNAPANAAIDTNGIIAFTPSEAQGPGTNTLTTVVSDNAQPPLSATNSFTVVINESNRPPVLPGQTNRSIVVLSTLSVTNSATDPDIPANALGYSLGAAPTNAAIDANGIITWTPLSFQAPSTNTFTTIVTDSNLSAINSQHLTATNSFQVVVLAIRNPPMLPAQSNRAITEPVTLIVTNQASENDVPTMPLSYQLVNPPTGALIDTNGVITWTPAAGQAPSTNLIETVVTDNPNGPGLTATNSFTVSVQPAPIIPAPVIKGIAVANGKVTLTWSAVSNHTYRVQYKPSLNQSNWVDLLPDVPATNPSAMSIDMSGISTQRFYRVFLLP